MTTLSERALRFARRWYGDESGASDRIKSVVEMVRRYEEFHAHPEAKGAPVTPPADSFGSRVRMIRELLGIDHAELGRRCGLRPSAISHLENGRRAPSLDTLYRLKAALGCSWDVLMEPMKRSDKWPITGGHIDTDVPPGRTT